MHEYSEDNLGTRALNWVVIGGAALLFVLASFSSLTPVSGTEQPQEQKAAISVPHAGHA
jgi:hypothetical protein